MKKREMKDLGFYFGIVLGLVFFTSAARACEEGRGLKDVMLDMNALTRALQTQLPDATQNEDSSAKAGQLRVLSLESLPMCVPKLEAMTDPVAKRIEYLEYQKLISQLYGFELDLEEALLKNDNSGAVDTLSKIKELQRTAHTRMRSSSTSKKGPSK